MTQNNKPRGYFKYVLALDSETTGVAFGGSNPTYDSKKDERFQAISWGFIVADAATLKPIEKLYLEIQYDDTHKWQAAAESVHGLSRKHLAKHGLTPEEAAEELLNMMLKYWSTDSCVCTLGHNHISFDLAFLRAWLEPLDVMFKLCNRHIDTNGIGFIAYGTHTSDALFEATGLPQRNVHNALTDTEYTLKAARITKIAFQQLMNED